MSTAMTWWRRASVAAGMSLSLVSAASAATTSDSFGSGTNQFNIDFVTISGDAGDLGSWPAGNRDPFTGVNRDDYRMGTYEITNAQWNKFQAAYGTVTGNPSTAYNESPYFTGATVPTNRVSWYEAAQFVNWLNTEAGHQAAYKFTGTQGTGDYALATWSAADADNGANLYRHKDAFYYLPTEDEWVKAGYWNGTSLQTWATPDDTMPVEDVEANYHHDYESGAQPWDVGSGSEELNGTYDMMGNVWEWMESPDDHTDDYYGIGAYRELRGGSYDSFRDFGELASSGGNSSHPDVENLTIGFRVASEVPEPETMSLLAIGGLALIKRRRR